MSEEWEDGELGFDNVRVTIPSEVEEREDDPIAWWVDDCIGVMQNVKDRDYSMTDVAAVVLLLAELENEMRKSGINPGKVSPVNWGERLQNLVEGN